jgi:carbon monoxide dehydrogenase subunit G
VRYDHGIRIERPPAEVFAFLADPRNLPLWQSGVEEVRLEGEPAKGARFTEVRSLLGKRIESTVEISAYVPAERFAIRIVDGPVQLEVDHLLRDDGGATELTVSGEGDPGKRFRFASGVLAKAVRHQAAADFERLRELLEAGR